MSNESMANQITDVPSAIAELLALNKQLKQQLEELKKDSLALAEFYGDRASYVAKQYKDSDTVFVKNDSEISNTSGLYEGGKRARQFLAKYRGEKVMKEINLNPDYKTMWKVECELNKQLKQQLEEKDEEIKQLKKEGMAVLSKLKEAVEVMNTIEKMEEDEEYPATRISKAAKMCRQFLAKYRGENETKTS